MINEDGENEVMASESCACEVDKLDETIKQISYKFLSYLAGEEVYTPESVVSREEPSYVGTPITKLRSYYRNLSVSEVHSMPNISIRKKNEWGFFGHSTIKHDYSLKTIKGDKVVVDNATGLMWHQSGSGHMDWNKAKDWVRSLNSSGYAGHHDWRLPTVEEAASLLESSNSNGQYIDPVFSKKQEWIWTGDSKDGSEAAWDVSFYLGIVRWDDVYYSFYVRPVRSVE
jgi:hypothetical protein